MMINSEVDQGSNWLPGTNTITVLTHLAITMMAVLCSRQASPFKSQLLFPLVKSAPERHHQPITQPSPRGSQPPHSTPLSLSLVMMVPLPNTLRP
jgi:hypothetical protein